VPHQAFAVRANQHELLFVAADELSDGNTAALRYGIGKQTVRLLSALVGAQEGSVFQADRIHGRERDELFKIDALVGFRLRGFQVPLRNSHVLIFSMLESADEIARSTTILQTGQ
jgi:hypothetical protein